jgi:formylglycine-generating enzyme required for sulfatase activity
MKSTLPLIAILIASAALTFAMVRANRNPGAPEVATPGASAVQTQAARSTPPAQPIPGMVWVAGGEFLMGTNDDQSWPAEHPAHKVRVDGFWIDETEITNAQFKQFVDATGYVTTAEQKPDWDELKLQLPPGTPKPPDDQLVAASMVFMPPDHEVALDDIGQWWTWAPGACWKHPEGPGSNLDGRETHPVVHVSWDDAMAYCKWAGKRLPTEAEWEYAARGGLVGKRYVWGDEPPSDTRPQCNIFIGRFPDAVSKQDQYPRTAPVKSFPPNGYGLYDMAGNVWEWCSDWYRADIYRQQLKASRGEAITNPQGPPKSYDPAEPFAPKRVHRGGSFLCNDSYCSNYRPSGRRGTTPDSAMSHLGFRCVKSAE